MHDTALNFGQLFFKIYLNNRSNLSVVDIGSQDVNGSLKSVMPSNHKYIGVDIAEGKGVDIIINDPYSLPFENESIDVVVTSSCFEHCEFFWLAFTEALRILKPDGLLYINVPSNGLIHRYPFDYWRFYPDSGLALENWGIKYGFNVQLLESFIGDQGQYGWNDFVAVFIKDKIFGEKYQSRIIQNIATFKNGYLDSSKTVINPVEFSQDQFERIALIKKSQQTNNSSN